MTKETLNRFRKILVKQKERLLFSAKVIHSDFEVSEDDRFDEVDLASTDTVQSMRFRLRNREILLYKKIDEALRRIEDGTFGECESCGNNIAVRRLEVRPTATLCVMCKEEDERKEASSVFGIQHKSLGHALSRPLGF